MTNENTPKNDFISRLCNKIEQKMEKISLVESAVSQKKNIIGAGHYVIGNTLYDEKGNVKTVFPEDNRRIYKIE